jgi:hypothetical protein
MATTKKSAKNTAQARRDVNSKRETPIPDTPPPAVRETPKDKPSDELTRALNEREMMRQFYMGKSVDESAAALNVPKSWVYETITAVAFEVRQDNKEWCAEQVRAMNRVQVQDEYDLERISRSAENTFNAQLQLHLMARQAETARLQRIIDGTATEHDMLGTVPGLSPDSKLLAQAIGAKKGKSDIRSERAKLIGLNAPTKIAPTNPVGDQPYNPSALTEADLDKMIYDRLFAADVTVKS